MISESARNDRNYVKYPLFRFALKYFWLSRNSFNVKYIVRNINSVSERVSNTFAHGSIRYVISCMGELNLSIAILEILV